MKQQKLLAGNHAAAKLDSLLRIDSIKRIFLVTGRRSYDNSGVREIIEKVFSSSKIDRFSDFQVNPQFDDIMAGLQQFRKHRYDLIIAAGGGTAIDVAKAIRFFAVQNDDPYTLLQGKGTFVPADHPPLLVIPTTAGSGSEATHFSVVYHNHNKYSLAHESMLPEYVCIDGAVSMTLPSQIAAYTGFDALCQAVESFWSVNSTEESKKYSKHALQLIMKHLQSSVEHGSAESRMSMAEAAYYAGKAINITKTTGAHAYSYYLTTHFSIPHGQAAGLLLDAFIIFNDKVTEHDISDSRGAAYLRETYKELYECLGSGDCYEAAAKVTALRRALSLDKEVGSLLDSPEHREAFFRSVNTQRLKNNPRLILEQNIGELKSLLFHEE